MRAIHFISHRQSGTLYHTEVPSVFSTGTWKDGSITPGQASCRHASINPDGSVGDVSVFATGANVVVAIAEGPDGALYYVDLDDSKIGRWEIV